MRRIIVIMMVLTIGITTFAIGECSVSAKLTKKNGFYGGEKTAQARQYGTRVYKVKLSRHRLKIWGGLSYERGYDYKTIKSKKRTFSISKGCKFYQNRNLPISYKRFKRVVVPFKKNTYIGFNVEHGKITSMYCQRD